MLGIIIYMVAMMGPKHLIHHLSRSLGVFVVSFGLVILFLGWQSLRVVGFPFIYLFVFGIVISDRIMTPITYELQDISAKGAWLVLYLAGYDTDLSGNTLTLFENGKAYPLNVAEACSGMRMLVAFLALGTAMAYVGLSRPWQRDPAHPAGRAGGDLRERPPSRDPRATFEDMTRTSLRVIFTPSSGSSGCSRHSSCSSS